MNLLEIILSLVGRFNSVTEMERHLRQVMCLNQPLVSTILGCFDDKGKLTNGHGAPMEVLQRHN